MACAVHYLYVTGSSTGAVGTPGGVVRLVDRLYAG